MILKEESFDEIYRKYARMLYAYVLQLCKNPTVAEDIVQTTFLKAIENADSYEGKSKVSTWLCRIAKNLWLDFCKSGEQKQVPLEQAAEAGEENGILQNLIQKEENAEIYQYIHKLPEPYKEVFMLRTMGGLSFQEIGEIFGKKEVWARVTFYRGKEKIKEKIKIRRREQ